ncbi:glycogen debranching protein [Actinotalea ferrariae CF5-4]|uniref:Glycogen debranching protein n=1 Tax=Actinotalea ferrariae CF5-4 TaxID=948458 RepID=A0A021VRM5_9CELL|nr:glycogen debranching protein GlgX [Actinotalea ferrariae]EYR63773.1 glycogen debranching protein [Actinotalea ferrariae CF5-4]
MKPPTSPSRSPHRLGVHLSGDGVDVAVLASHATAVDLCLLDRDPAGPDGWAERRIPLAGPDLGVWHAHVPGVRAGQRYGFRAHGRWDPAAGTRYNPAKLLVDPYARGLAGSVLLGQAVHGHRVQSDGRTLGTSPELDPTDSRAAVPHGVVVDDRFDGPAVPRPRVPWADTVIYEAHVRGLTKELPGVPEHLRGTYAGLAHPATIEHLRSLGVTTVELLPIQAVVDEPHLTRRGLVNYWGYNTLGFFAPQAAYATAAAQEAGAQAVLDEVKGMVRLLHAAGIEVLLDIVLNHTCEGGTDGLHLSWRGLDPTVYYLHDGGSPARFADVTGCGNTLDFRRPRVVQMALDSLRYWADVVGVDGFRFDLAVTLGRDADGFNPAHPFLVALQTDPVLGDRKLVAEPWDLGPGGWRTGQFPAPMAEWNDRFRDAVRTFWLADPREAAHGRPGHGVRDLATRLAGSADLFGHSDPPLVRGTVASVNFVTAHDGFTLADLVAYEHKHNEANGEGNLDGTDNNRSWNHGIEGTVTGSSFAMDILPLRRRSMRNLLGTLLLSAGTPMITAGDEIGRTQHGNNNAYCLDDATSWVHWDLAPWRQDLLATARHLLALRREHPALRSPQFFLGRPRTAGDGSVLDQRRDLDWRAADGAHLRHEQWLDPAVRTLQMTRTAQDGSAVLLVINGALDPVEVTLTDGARDRWELVWDSVAEHPDHVGSATGTTGEDPADEARTAAPGDRFTAEPLSLRVYVSR